MIRGWTSSNSTRRQGEQAFEALASAKDEVTANGRAATAEPVSPGSFYTRPHDVAPLAVFDDGVAAALRRHLNEQGLPNLAGQVDELESIGRQLIERDTSDDSVSEVVYEMH